MKKIVLTVALVLLSSVAFAKSKTPPPAQNHSCVLSGAVVEKTKKECIKAGGKWEKNDPATTAPAVDTTKPVETPVTK
jgi:hypothetical protein